MIRVVMGLVVLVFVGMIAVGITSPSTGTKSTPVPAAGTVYSSDVLARASAMTQQMSGNGPISGHEYHPHTNDQQLRLSSDPGFVRELEGYQQQVDRMLALNQ